MRVGATEIKENAMDMPLDHITKMDDEARATSVPQAAVEAVGDALDRRNYERHMMILARAELIGQCLQCREIMPRNLTNNLCQYCGQPVTWGRIYSLPGHVSPAPRDPVADALLTVVDAIGDDNERALLVSAFQSVGLMVTCQACEAETPATSRVCCHCYTWHSPNGQTADVVVPA